MKDKMKFNTEGIEKAFALAKMEADKDKAQRAEWSAGEMQDEREKEQQSIKHAVHIHDRGGELGDMQNLKTEGKKISTSKYVNNCAHSLVVLVLCVFGTCRAFLVPVEVFSHGVLMLIFRAPVFVCLKGP